MHTRLMPFHPPARDSEVAELRAELDAERTGAEHWRRLANQRSEELAALRHRLSVRALLSAERRMAPLAAWVGAAGSRMRSAAGRLALTADALCPSRTSPKELTVPPPRGHGLSRRIAIVVVGPADHAWASTLPPTVEVVGVAEPTTVRHAIARTFEECDPQLLGVVAGTSEPLDPGWLSHLVAQVDGRTVAAVPLVVHPHRPVHRATPHDGLVRSAGVGLRLDGQGMPLAEALDAGAMPEPDGERVEVDAGGGAALVVDRGAYEAAGGLADSDDLDAAAVELCARLRRRGGSVALVPAAVVVDHRPVRAKRELGVAVDPRGLGWAAAVRRSGAALRRAADTRSAPPLRLALTVAAPSSKVANRWGDWHLAQALAVGLRRAGQEVLVQTADHADDLPGRSCDVHVVVRGLQPVRRTPGQRHVLWIISHPESIEDHELDAADLVLAASPRFAECLRRRTDTPVDVLLQATDHRRFRPRQTDPTHRHDVTIVAKTRDVMRPAVADALDAGLMPRIYGAGWRTLVDPQLIVADHVDNEILPVVYSSAGVVLNDHWRTMRAWGFVSNRLFDVLACGTPVISDPVDGIDELFEGAVLEYRTPRDLRDLVDAVLVHPDSARRRVDRGRKAVLANHTFDHRARQLLDAIGALVETCDPTGLGGAERG
jgi:glycosyltransferase involved in cell wall biosynthesis